MRRRPNNRTVSKRNSLALRTFAIFSLAINLKTLKLNFCRRHQRNPPRLTNLMRAGTIFSVFCRVRTRFRLGMCRFGHAMNREPRVGNNKLASHRYPNRLSQSARGFFCSAGGFAWQVLTKQVRGYSDGAAWAPLRLQLRQALLIRGLFLIVAGSGIGRMPSIV